MCVQMWGNVNNECAQVKGNWLRMVFQMVFIYFLRDGYWKRRQLGPPRCTTPGGTTLFVVVDDVNHTEYRVWVLLAVCGRVVLAPDFSFWMSCRVAKPLVLLYPSSFLGPTLCVFLSFFLLFLKQNP